MKEPDSPVVVIRKCIAVSRKNFLVVEGFIHVCLAASQKDIQYINLFCSQPRNSVTLSTQLNRCGPFTLFIRLLV